MMNGFVTELATVMSTRRACALLGMPRAARFRPTGRMHGPRLPGPKPVNALTDAETAEVLAVLRAPEHCELAPAQVWARLLDIGIFLCSISTMYRILRAVGEVGDRRRQRTHPAKKKPELIATKPCQIWSWDITKLRTEIRGVYFELYVIIDIFSRYVVGWLVAERETGEIAKDFIEETYRQQGIVKGQLALHADRGTSMTSKPVSQLLVDLGVDRSHSRPHVSNDNPYSEAAFKTLKYCPAFPESFGSIQDARAFCQLFFSYYNDRHYHSGIALLTPATVHYGDTDRVQTARATTLDLAYAQHPERFNRPPRPLRMPESAWINDPSREANIRNK